MATEILPSRPVIETYKNKSTTRIWTTTWADRETDPDLPDIGDLHPDYTDLRCGRKETEGIGQTASVAVGAGYAKARITAEYTSYDWVSVEERFEFSAQAQQIDGIGFHWESDDDPCGKTWSMVFPFCAYVREARLSTLSNVRTALIASVGKINSKVYQDFPKGTLLFNGASVVREESATGAKYWKVSYKFTYNRAGWNYVLRSELTYDVPVTSGGSHLYQETNFNSLPGI